MLYDLPDGVRETCVVGSLWAITAPECEGRIVHCSYFPNIREVVHGDLPGEDLIGKHRETVHIELRGSPGDVTFRGVPSLRLSIIPAIIVRRFWVVQLLKVKCGQESDAVWVYKDMSRSNKTMYNRRGSRMEVVQRISNLDHYLQPIGIGIEPEKIDAASDSPGHDEAVSCSLVVSRSEEWQDIRVLELAPNERLGQEIMSTAHCAPSRDERGHYLHGHEASVRIKNVPFHLEQAVLGVTAVPNLVGICNAASQARNPSRNPCRKIFCLPLKGGANDTFCPSKTLDKLL